MLTPDQLRIYQLGFDDALRTMYEEVLATLSDIKSGNLDIDHAIKEMSNELAKRM